MNLTELGLAVAVLLLAAATGTGIGYAWAQYNAAAQITLLTSDRNVCVASIAGTGAALADLKQKYADLDERHQQMVRLGNNALAERDQQIDQLKADAAKRQTAIAEKAHDPDCAALARLPVCPGIAEQLFPAGAEADGH